ncbi:MAG TPA: hypothetical protein VH331_08920 [Allosphingosinicella sp.]|jgi:hypothetical protein|nr:hypothetical protein [Allosphingosinicella sp.]
MAKTWKQKLDIDRTPHVEVLERPFGGAPPGARMLVSTPREVDGYIRGLPRGATQSVPTMREALAKTHGADIACPMSTAMFARIAAEAALEEVHAGKSVDDVAPFWRVIEPSSALAKKLSCGADFIEQRRMQEA